MSDAIDVFAFPVAGPVSAETLSVLSSREKERVKRFPFEADRRRYANSHAGLRAILGRRIRLPASELKIGTGRFGKPFLVSDPAIEFNLSHSGGWALVALAPPGCTVGVDVEEIVEDRASVEIAHRFFSSREVSRWLRLPSEERCAAFFRCWTRKESFVKASGFGLSADLAAFDVDFSRHAQPQILATRPDPSEAEKWRLSDIDVGDKRYVAALTATAFCGAPRIHRVATLPRCR